VPRGLRAICARAMARVPEERYQTAGELAAALEAFEAGALAGGPASKLGYAIGIATWVTFALFLFGLYAITQIMPTLREQGQAAYVAVVFAAGGLTLSAIEWGTRGRHHAGPIALAFALCTLCSGVVATATGMGRVLQGMAAEEVVTDAIAYRHHAAVGVREALGNLASSGALAAVQLLAWGIARRRAALAEAAARR
jgi:hypothetical protein